MSDSTPIRPASCDPPSPPLLYTCVSHWNFRVGQCFNIFCRGSCLPRPLRRTLGSTFQQGLLPSAGPGQEGTEKAQTMRNMNTMRRQSDRASVSVWRQHQQRASIMVDNAGAREWDCEHLRYTVRSVRWQLESRATHTVHLLHRIASHLRRPKVPRQITKLQSHRHAITVHLKLCTALLSL